MRWGLFGAAVVSWFSWTYVLPFCTRQRWNRINDAIEITRSTTTKSKGTALSPPPSEQVEGDEQHHQSDQDANDRYFALKIGLPPGSFTVTGLPPPAGTRQVSCSRNDCAADGEASSTTFSRS